jgi:hypothetical protein
MYDLPAHYSIILYQAALMTQTARIPFVLNVMLRVAQFGASSKESPASPYATSVGVNPPQRLPRLRSIASTTNVWKRRVVLAIIPAIPYAARE